MKRSETHRHGHISKANWYESAVRMTARVNCVHVAAEEDLVHPANEYLQDDKGRYQSAVTSPSGGSLGFLP